MLRANQRNWIIWI